MVAYLSFSICVRESTQITAFPRSLFKKLASNSFLAALIRVYFPAGLGLGGMGTGDKESVCADIQKGKLMYKTSK
jgi:hypothetical protein